MMERSRHIVATRERVTNDVHRLSVPYPSGYVNVFLVLDGGGARLIDAGHHSEASRAALLRLLAEVGVAPADIREILLTHAHPDHIGSAGALAAASGAPIRIHRAELLPDRPGWPPRFESDWLRRHGLPAGARVPIDDRTSLPPGVLPLNGDETLSFGPLELRLVATPGHSPGLLCMHEAARGWLFSSDQLLRVPTPLFLMDEGPGDPVGAYLDGLARLELLSADLVLPGHGRGYTGLAAQVARARRGQEVRLAEVLEEVPLTGATGHEVCRRLGWAAGRATNGRLVVEAIALGRLLAYLRRLERVGEVCFDAGTGHWYRTPGGRPAPG